MPDERLESSDWSFSFTGKEAGPVFFDMLIPMIALFLIFVVAGAGASTGTDAGVGAGVIFGIILFAGYFVWDLMLFVNGMTPGKKLLGIKVVKEDGSDVGFFTMFIREAVGKAISGMIFSLGFLWILFDRDKQGWHDKLVSTYVVQ